MTIIHHSVRSRNKRCSVARHEERWNAKWPVTTRTMEALRGTLKKGSVLTKKFWLRFVCGYLRPLNRLCVNNSSVMIHLSDKLTLPHLYIVSIHPLFVWKCFFGWRNISAFIFRIWMFIVRLIQTEHRLIQTTYIIIKEQCDSEWFNRRIKFQSSEGLKTWNLSKWGPAELQQEQQRVSPDPKKKTENVGGLVNRIYTYSFLQYRFQPSITSRQYSLSRASSMPPVESSNID